MFDIKEYLFLIDALKVIPGETQDDDLLSIAIDLPESR